MREPYGNEERSPDEGEKPRPRRKESAYFENAELPKLFAQVPEGVYRTLFLVALKTGMRQGELAALTWATLTSPAAISTSAALHGRQPLRDEEPTRRGTCPLPQDLDVARPLAVTSAADAAGLDSGEHFLGTSGGDGRRLFRSSRNRIG